MACNFIESVTASFEHIHTYASFVATGKQMLTVCIKASDLEEHDLCVNYFHVLFLSPHLLFSLVCLCVLGRTGHRRLDCF